MISDDQIKQIALSNTAPWVIQALIDKNNHVTRIDGPGNNPRILEYWLHTNYNPKTDQESYCAAAMNTWLYETHYKGTNDPAARSFMDLPKLDKFKPGCICVFSRPGSNWMGHVTCGLLEMYETVLCIGANQGEWVKEYPKDRLLGYYWPEKR